MLDMLQSNFVDSQQFPPIMRLARMHPQTAGAPAPYDPIKQRPTDFSMSSSTCERASSTTEGLFHTSDSDRKKDD